MVDDLTVDNIVFLNNSGCRIGEELGIRVYFSNPAKVEMKAIYVNGIKASIVGGDRVETAIIRFVPNQEGLIDFCVDKIEYLLFGKTISQHIDSDAVARYPVFGNLIVSFEPVTSLYYENTGHGIYLEFDNPKNYSLYTINGAKFFLQLGKGQYYYYGGNSITQIEYGYDNFGSTSQTFNYSVQVWNVFEFTDSNKGYVRYKAVSTVDDFLAMRGGYYYLKNDIDVRNVTLTEPIEFSGVLVGNGFKIQGLSNVADTTSGYFDIFNQSGTFYDVVFTELFISVNSNPTKHINIKPLGLARLVNCMVNGDIIGNKYVSLGSIENISNSSSYDLNVTIDGEFNRIQYTAHAKLDKNERVSVTSSEVIFTFPNGKKYYFGSFNKELTKVILSDDYCAVGKGAFYECTKLKEFYAPEENCICWGGIFSEQCQLETIRVPCIIILSGKNKELLQSVTIVPCNHYTSMRPSFDGCQNLISVTIIDGVTDISSFARCSSLTSITIPASVTSIGDGAFSGCTGLATVYYGGSEESAKALLSNTNDSHLLNATWYYLVDSHPLEACN